MTPDVAQRSRQAQLVVAIVYVGIPLVFAALTVWVSAESFRWTAVVVPLVLLVAGWFFRRQSRYRPSRWSGAGALMGAVTGLFTVVFGGLALLVLPAAVLGAIIGAALGRYGERRLMHPAIAELADTPYELAFRVRGLTRLQLVIDDKSATLREFVRVNRPESMTTYPLEAITGIHDVSLSGAERLRFPMSLRLPPTSSPGPALILQAQGADWVLPHDEAAAVAQILTRRVEAARTP